MIQFFKNIRKIRENKGYSQEYMAGLLNVSQRSYSKMETGEVNISVNKLIDICKILEVEVAEVLGFEGKHIYNNVVTTQKGNGFVINQAEKNIELYERIISDKNTQLAEKDSRIKLLEEFLNKKNSLTSFPIAIDGFFVFVLPSGFKILIPIVE